MRCPRCQNYSPFHDLCPACKLEDCLPKTEPTTKLELSSKDRDLLDSYHIKVLP